MKKIPSILHTTLCGVVPISIGIFLMSYYILYADLGFDCMINEFNVD